MLALALAVSIARASIGFTAVVQEAAALLHELGIGRRERLVIDESREHIERRLRLVVGRKVPGAVDHEIREVVGRANVAGHRRIDMPDPSRCCEEVIALTPLHRIEPL